MKDKCKDKDEDADYVFHNKTMLFFLPNFKILLPEKSLTQIAQCTTLE